MSQYILSFPQVRELLNIDSRQSRRGASVEHHPVPGSILRGTQPESGPEPVLLAAATTNSSKKHRSDEKCCAHALRVHPKAIASRGEVFGELAVLKVEPSQTG